VAAKMSELQVVLETSSPAVSRQLITSSRVNSNFRVDLSSVSSMMAGRSVRAGPVGSRWRRRSARGATSWVRGGNRFRVSEALHLTLTGLTDRAKTCAISLGSGLIVSVSCDNTCKIVDMTTSPKRTSLTGQWFNLDLCSPRGLWRCKLLSGSPA
jgi:hypothetical protein